ncbi:MAG TPA: hypothetical protein V6C65_07465 [Allocoleopsis sp.]
MTISGRERCANGKTGSPGEEVIGEEKVEWISDRDNVSYFYLTTS